MLLFEVASQTSNQFFKDVWTTI